MCVGGGGGVVLVFCAVFSVLPSLQSSRWGVSALCLFLAIPWVGLHRVIVAFPVILTYLLRVGHIECIPVCNVIKLQVLHKIFIFSVHFVTRLLSSALISCTICARS